MWWLRPNLSVPDIAGRLVERLLYKVGVGALNIDGSMPSILLALQADSGITHLVPSYPSLLPVVVRV